MLLHQTFNYVAIESNNKYYTIYNSNGYACVYRAIGNKNERTMPALTQ